MILVCAATRTEAVACRAGIAAARVAGWEVIATGVGPERASGALRRRLAAGAPALVVSAGFAGALTPALEPLSWITASALHAVAGGRIVQVALPRGALRTADGVTACRVVTASAIERRTAAALPGPVAVDMESAALAEVAAAAGVPFVVLRLVTDSPDRPYPEFVNGLAAALAAGAPAQRAAHGARAVVGALRSPLGALAFLRDAARWRAPLRDGWRAHAARGLPVSPVD